MYRVDWSGETSNEKLPYLINRPTNIFANDFFNRRVSAWNSLPSFIVNSKSLASFKRSVVSVDLSKFLVYAV